MRKKIRKRIPRDKKLRIAKNFVINHATEQEMIEIVSLMRLRKTSLDLIKEAEKRQVYSME